MSSNSGWVGDSLKPGTTKNWALRERAGHKNNFYLKKQRAEKVVRLALAPAEGKNVASGSTRLGGPPSHRCVARVHATRVSGNTTDFHLPNDADLTFTEAGSAPGAWKK